MEKKETEQETEIEETPVEAYIDDLGNTDKLSDEPLSEESSEKGESSEEKEEEEEEVSEEESNDKEETPPKPGDIEYTKKVSKKIDKLTWEKREAERDAEYWKNKALGKGEPDEKAESQSELIEPKQEDFETDAEYFKALGTYQYQVEKVKDATESKKQQEKTEIDNLYNKFNERVEASGIREKNPDFDDLIESPIFTPAMTELVLSSEVGPEMALFLAQNTEKTQAIANMSPLGAAKEIGKIEIQLTQKPNRKDETSAPKPINTLTGKDVPRVNLSTCSQEDYETVRKKQMKAAGRW